MADVVAAIYNLGDKETTTDFYYVGGTVSVASTGIWSGKLTFSFTDGTNTIKAYNCYNLNGTNFSTKDDVAVGDYVVVYGNLEKFVKNNEVTYEVVNGQLAKLESGDNTTTTTYTFTTKAWGDSTNGWERGKDGNQFTSGRGVQVTKGVTGANATSITSFTNVSKVVVTYSTNASDGAGSIAIQVGSNTAHSQNVTKTGGTTDRTLTYTISPNETGEVKLTVTCTTNSIYVKSVAITHE